MNTSDEDEHRPHFALFPFLAQGHLLPMADIARLLAQHGVKVTILTTHFNASRIQPSIYRSKLNIDIAHLEFPSAAVDLPESVQSMDKVRNFEEAAKFFHAAFLLKEQLRQLLEGLRPFPSCLIADMCYPWAGDLAGELGIPRIVFHGTNCFSLLCRQMADVRGNFEEIASDTEYFVLPNFPHRIEMTKAQLRGMIDPPAPEWLEFRDDVLRADREAFGTLANTFQELEPEYVKECEKITGKKVWCVGPVSLCNSEESDKAERGSKPAIDGQDCLKFLDSKEPRSVLYACLGSLSTLAPSQLIEIGIALENCGHPFIWVVRDSPEDLEKWISERGFKEKVKERGLIVRGWAPQVLILSHPSVGGFLTHCGWNSTLEGISYGVPMLTWPVLGEQFCNERFVVDVVGIGVRVGVELPIVFGDAERVGIQVRSEGIRRGIEELMGGERRERANELAMAANRAVEEGGSSYVSIDRFIEDIVRQQQKEKINTRDKIE